jgi:hypothetical protein
MEVKRIKRGNVGEARQPLYGDTLRQSLFLKAFSKDGQGGGRRCKEGVGG